MKSDKEKRDYILSGLTDRDPHTASFCSSYKHEKGSPLAIDHAPSASWYDSGDSSQYALMTVLFQARKIVNTLRPMPRTLVFLDKKQSFTTGKDYVFVSTEMYTDQFEYSEEFKFDIFLGLTIHEIAHLLNTDFSSYMKHIKMVEKKLKKKAFADLTTEGKITDRRERAVAAKNKGQAHASYYHTLYNTIEDERIETIESLKTPAYAQHLAATKHHYFNLLKHAMEALKKEKGYKEEGLMAKANSEVFNIIRYPANIDQTFINKHLDFFVQIREALDPYPTEFEDVLVSTDRVYELMMQFYEDNKEEIEKEQEASENDAKSKILKELSEALKAAISKEAEDRGFEKSEEEADGGDEEKTSPSASGEEEGEEGLEEDNSTATATHDGSYSPRGIPSGTVAKIIRQEDVGFHPGHPSHVNWSKKKGDAKKYLELKKSVIKYVPALRKKLVLESLEKAINVKSCRTGHLDTAKLAEGVQGVQTVYQRQGTQKVSKMGVCVLIDESGSMHGEKIAQARKAAMLLTLAVDKIPNIELFIYGHTADVKFAGSTDMSIYKEPGIKVPQGLTEVRARDMNRDGYAIQACAHRVRKFTDRPTMMFILSDGQPAAYFYGNKGIEHTRKVANELPKMGFMPVHIAIEDGLDGEEMFKHCLKMTDLSKLPIQLGKLLNSSFVKNAQKAITYV